MVDELPRRVQALAAMTQQAWSIGLSVEVQEESTIHHSKAAMKHIKTVLQFS